ncbi:YitT family protein [Aneurinibacillus sp. Ricciae_BoGa-3]|uniref:YitT family protein n=1 Tax=Aneurinibacillus sp. Ricciae_BoGa-3 TaxID=3022697 RepID=UPI002340F24F|nr:YitT family protein [Aneurinibacillus sp. Ricciae_BoGa-3]WCK53249.1 YitT family protein [Aneurinibacillus sp. Ricciae_BoGa-3]
MFKKLASIGLGSMFIGVGVNGFILPLHLLNGGVMGIGLLVKYLWGFKVGLTMICLSLPIYLLALKYERPYFFNSLFGMLASSIMIDILFPLKELFDVPIAEGAFIGGLFIGSGVGLMLRNKISPGGMDLMALLMSKWFSINVGIIIFFIDICIVTFGLYILGGHESVYSLLTVLGVGLASSVITSFKSVNIYLS